MLQFIDGYIILLYVRGLFFCSMITIRKLAIIFIIIITIKNDNYFDIFFIFLYLCLWPYTVKNFFRIQYLYKQITDNRLFIRLALIIKKVII